MQLQFPVVNTKKRNNKNSITCCKCGIRSNSDLFTEFEMIFQKLQNNVRIQAPQSLLELLPYCMPQPLCIEKRITIVRSGNNFLAKAWPTAILLSTTTLHRLATGSKHESTVTAKVISSSCHFSQTSQVTRVTDFVYTTLTKRQSTRQKFPSKKTRRPTRFPAITSPHTFSITYG